MTIILVVYVCFSLLERSSSQRKRCEFLLTSTIMCLQIHWFSIFNSFMMVIFLTGLVAIILMRTLRKDYARWAQEMGDFQIKVVLNPLVALHRPPPTRYAKIEDDLESLERDLSEESGWKLVHGDVFRPPHSLITLAACVGTGMQLALLSLSVILLTIAGNYFEERGTILTAFIVCYALTSFIGGFFSGGFYARHEGRYWIRVMVLTAGLFPGKGGTMSPPPDDSTLPHLLRQASALASPSYSTQSPSSTIRWLRCHSGTSWPCCCSGLSSRFLSASSALLSAATGTHLPTSRAASKGFRARFRTVHGEENNMCPSSFEDSSPLALPGT